MAAGDRYQVEKTPVQEQSDGNIEVPGIIRALTDVWDAINHFLGFSLITAIAGEDTANNVLKVEQRFNGAVISSAATTTIKNGSGFIHSINIVGGTLGAITVYDSTSGSGQTILPTFTPTAAVPCPPITLNQSFTTGLTIVTAAATIINVVYR